MGARPVSDGAAGIVWAVTLPMMGLQVVSLEMVNLLSGENLPPGYLRH